MELYSLTINELRDKIKNKEVTVKEVLDSVYSRIDSVENKINAYISFTKEYAYKRAEILQKRLDNNEDIGNLGGIPIAIKDNISMKDTKTTCASKMLENYTAIYNADVVDRLENDGAIIIGKTNMDEFAMGSSTENSYFKKTTNPYDITKVPGGSSGGSSAAISSDMAIASLGSDTGGSIRQPASYCSNVGLKPTYGLVSRFGLIAFGSSLDQIGPFTKDVTDAAIMLNTLAGYDKKDTTSINKEKVDYTKALTGNMSNVTLGIPTKYLEKGVNEDVLKAFNDAVETYKSLGAKIVEVDFKYMSHALSCYYIIATAEASSNLGRYDGIKYGYRTPEFDSLEDLYKKSRTEGFGEEVKRRIMLGTYVLSSGYYDAYYKKAGQVRTLIINEFKEIFNKVDGILMPTAPNTAFKFGSKTSNPIEMYLEDIFTVPINIAGIPAMSIPCGFDKENMPIGMQIMTNVLEEEKLLNIGYAFEKVTNFKDIKPKI